jgi:hypothetical protein
VVESNLPFLCGAVIDVSNGSRDRVSVVGRFSETQKSMMPSVLKVWVMLIIDPQLHDG